MGLEDRMQNFPKCYYKIQIEEKPYEKPKYKKLYDCEKCSGKPQSCPNYTNLIDFHGEIK